MPATHQLAVTEHVPEGPGRDGPVVVLVHGSLDRASSFARVVRRLDDLHTLAYDRRGYDRSRVFPVHDSIDGHVDDLLAVVNGRPAVVIGHSYGGVIAIGAALREGARGSILSLGAYEPPLPWLGFRRNSPGSRGAAASSEAEDAGEAAERFFRRMVGDSAWERLPEKVKQARRADGPALVAELGAIRLEKPPFDPTQLAVPAVFGRGGASLPHHRDAVEWLVTHIGGSVMFEIPGAAHGAHLTHPDAFADFVRHRGGTRRYSGAASVRVLVSGASGLIGTTLVERLEVSGHSVTRLVRRTESPTGDAAGDASAGGAAGGGSGGNRILWDPALGILDVDTLARAGRFDAVVNLAGAGIGDRRWSLSRKQTILASRISSTRLLATSLAALDRPPSTLLNASAVGFYGDRGREELTEASGSGSGFLAAVCRAWEAAAAPASEAGIRTVLLRSGIVLTARGGVLARQLPLFRLGLGGRVGRGDQYRSWITLEDEVRAVLYCLEEEGLRGPVNVTSPRPATDVELARALGDTLGRPAVLAVPGFALRVALGSEMATELLLTGQRALPEALSERGFHFSYEDLVEGVRWAIADRRRPG